MDEQTAQQPETREAAAEPKTLWNALFGAVVTILLSFTVISPLLGGGLAGYLQRESPMRGLRVGAISGAMAMVPFVLMVLFGLTMVASMPGGGLGIPGATELVVVLVMFVVLAAWTVGLSAAGGYLGAALRNRLRSEATTAGTPDHAD